MFSSSICSFCGVVSYFFRLSHFTFGLPYVLFCGVVIHTFFGCPILLLGFHTFFFAVSLYILFSVVPFYFWASIRSFLRCRYTYFFRLSHFTFRLPYVLFCGVVIHTFFSCPILLLGFHTFFFAVSLYILFSVVPFYFWASIRSFLRSHIIHMFSP